ncbi:hypothetical protein RND71_004531 [Anisodus tanguticus]|uniref:Uncharacterized protein n=1 Tax=Anisodus tanguticus TaxID=243964 RepID=A0AAE1VUD6_9SOLA|nr:hypothetical protein RND71_004531 [Anisodus tanguticus]
MRAHTHGSSSQNQLSSNSVNMANKLSFFFCILLVSLAVEVMALRDLPLLEQVQVIEQIVRRDMRCFDRCNIDAACKDVIGPRKCTNCRKGYSSVKKCYAN